LILNKQLLTHPVATAPGSELVDPRKVVPQKYFDNRVASSSMSRESHSLNE